MKEKTNIVARLYWLLPVLLFCLQAIYTFRSMGQIRYEELAESVRNVYWLQHRTIYDGMSTNIGWYGTLLCVYNFFGFRLFTAKFVRLALHLVSLLCLAGVLRKWLGTRNAWLPLITIGLSPTLLYFNTFQTSYGIDLQYFPICLFLITTIRFHKTWPSIAKQILLWALVMMGCMSYPTFVLYLPVLAILYARQLIHQGKGQGALFIAKNILLSFMAFFLPLAAGFLYVKDRSLLWYDPIARSGIFRGGGNIGWDFHIFIACLKLNLGDLFVRGRSYYFELLHSDFSGATGTIPIVFVMITGVVLFFMRKSLRPIILIAWILLALNLIFSNLDPHAPGIRRCTGMLVAIYAIYVIVWYFLTHWSTGFVKLKWIGILICILLPIHHVLVYPENLSGLVKPSRFRDTIWFNVRSTPEESLAFWLEHTKEGKGLILMDQFGNPIIFRYSDIYSALAGYRRWNGLEERTITAYDVNGKGFIPLSIKLWEDYYFKH